MVTLNLDGQLLNLQENYRQAKVLPTTHFVFSTLFKFQLKTMPLIDITTEIKPDFTLLFYSLAINKYLIKTT